MKTNAKGMAFGLALVFTAASLALGQGHHHGNKHHGKGGHHNGHGNNGYSHHQGGHYDYRPVPNQGTCDNMTRVYYSTERPVIVYRREVYPAPRPIVQVRPAPRYVFFQDHDVYYDCRQQVFITFGGRGWTVTREVPYGIGHVDLRMAPRVELDYFGDDLIGYLEAQRPSAQFSFRW